MPAWCSQRRTTSQTLLCCATALCNSAQITDGDTQVCVIGAGKMSRLLFKHMAAKGCTSAVLLNRSLPRAQAMAEEFPQVRQPQLCCILGQL